MLLPLCVSDSWGLSIVYVGLCLGQFVEGAARWSCAPLWHRISAATSACLLARLNV